MLNFIDREISKTESGLVSSLLLVCMTRKGMLGLLLHMVLPANQSSHTYGPKIVHPYKIWDQFCVGFERLGVFWISTLPANGY